jgi:hypothetical protein
MKIKEAVQALASFRSLLDAGCSEMHFKVAEPKLNEKMFRDWFRDEVPYEGASKKSGVYFIADLDQTILYIGKAGTNNLGAEIWGKFRAPTRVDEGDKPYFGNSTLAKYAPEEDVEIIRKGEVLITAVTIEHKDFASLAEVYLHVLCSRRDDWPRLNKRIG